MQLRESKMPPHLTNSRKPRWVEYPTVTAHQINFEFRPIPSVANTIYCTMLVRWCGDKMCHHLSACCRSSRVSARLVTRCMSASTTQCNLRYVQVRRTSNSRWRRKPCVSWSFVGLHYIPIKVESRTFAAKILDQRHNDWRAIRRLGLQDWWRVIIEATSANVVKHRLERYQRRSSPAAQPINVTTCQRLNVFNGTIQAKKPWTSVSANTRAEKCHKAVAIAPLRLRRSYRFVYHESHTNFLVRQDTLF